MFSERTFTLSLEGDLGAYDLARVESLFPPPSAYTRIVIDCSMVNSMESTIIASIMRFRHSFATAGNDPHDIVIVSSERLRRLFELTGVSRFVTVIYPGAATH